VAEQRPPRRVPQRQLRQHHQRCPRADVVGALRVWSVAGGPFPPASAPLDRSLLLSSLKSRPVASGTSGCRLYRARFVPYFGLPLACLAHPLVPPALAAATT